MLCVRMVSAGRFPHVLSPASSLMPAVGTYNSRFIILPISRTLPPRDFIFLSSRVCCRARERRSEAAQRGVLEDAAEDAAAEEFIWPGTLLPRTPAPESTLRRSLARALFVVCRGSCAQPAPRVLVTKRKRTPRAAPRPCGRRCPVHHPFRNFGARERASARSRARALRCLPRLGARSACGVLATRRKGACRLDAAATLCLWPFLGPG